MLEPLCPIHCILISFLPIGTLCGHVIFRGAHACWDTTGLCIGHLTEIGILPYERRTKSIQSRFQYTYG